MDKMDGLSLNLEKDNIDRIKELFPEAVEEGKINFDMLRAMLGDEVDDSKEKYQFAWNGKAKSIKLAQTPSSATLRPCKDKSKNWDTTENIYIEGDNLEVLKQLQKTYYGKIKMIYIDPPYNTGNDFVYMDDFSDTRNEYISKTKQGLISNPNISGKYHTRWLNMMYSRLIIAKTLLKNDGAIFISIDDNELFNLKKICDEIFGETNYLNTINVYAKASSGASGGGEDKRLKKNIEYILAYVKDINSFNLTSPTQEKPLVDYIEERRKENVSFAYKSIMYNPGKLSYYKTIKAGNGEDIELFKVTGYEIKSVNELMKKENMSEKEVYEKYYDQIFTTENAQTSIRTRVYESDEEKDDYVIARYTPVSGRNKGIVTDVGFIGNKKRLVSYLSNVAKRNENNEIVKVDKVGTLWNNFSWSSVGLEGNVSYSNGKKPILLIQQLMNICDIQTGDIVLDFFSGSATTGHAVIDYNKKNDAKAKFILVQLDENLDETINIASGNNKKVITDAISVLDRHGMKHDLSKLGIIRLKNVIDDNLFSEETSEGFKVFKLDSSNINEWDSGLKLDEKELAMRLGEVFKTDRSKEDILYEIMLKYGVFDKQVEEIDVNGKTMYRVGKRYMIVCLTDHITSEDVKAIGELSPRTVIFNEAGFNNDNDKINAVYNLEKAGVEDVKCI